MNVLVIGGNRFVGRSVVERLVERGCAVTVLNRGRFAADYPAGVTHVMGNRKDEAVLRELAGNLSFDVIVDMVAYEAEDIDGVRRAFGGRIAQYVFISSSFVYAVTRNPPPTLRESDFSRDVLDLSDVPPYKQREYAYGLNKRACELALGSVPAGDFAVTILRPPYMFGERDHAMLPCYVRRLLDGRPVILPDGGLNRMSLAYGPDVAGAVDRCVGNQELHGETLNVAGDAVVTLRDFMLTLRRHVGSASDVVDVPAAFVYQHVESAAFPCSNPFDLVLDTARQRERLGVVPTPFEDALARASHAVAARCEASPSEEYVRNRPEELRVVDAWQNSVSVL